MGFDKLDLICTVLILSLPHFWLLAGKETVFQEQAVLWCRQIAAELRGGGKVKHRKLLRESCLIGHNLFSREGRAKRRAGTIL